MNLTARLSRRLAAGVGLATAAILLPTAALASSVAAGSSADPAYPGQPAIAGCVAANTRVWYGLPADHSAGHAYYEFQFSNIGRSTCTLYGYPGVSQLNSAGHQIGLPASHYGSRVSVTLAPGATAHVVLVVVDAVQQPDTGNADQGLPAWPVPLPVGTARDAGLPRPVRAWGGLRPAARRNPRLLHPVADRSPVAARGLTAGGQSPSDPGLAGTSIACSRSASSGTMSSARSWVEARTT